MPDDKMMEVIADALMGLSAAATRIADVMERQQDRLDQMMPPPPPAPAAARELLERYSKNTRDFLRANARNMEDWRGPNPDLAGPLDRK